jgi:hypothetical protein
MISNRNFVRSLIAGTILALSVLAAVAETATVAASQTVDNSQRSRQQQIKR